MYDVKSGVPQVSVHDPLLFSHGPNFRGSWTADDTHLYGPVQAEDYSQII